jgi:uncharacterized membrane protein YoaK (UPF0700 family)
MMLLRLRPEHEQVVTEQDQVIIVSILMVTLTFVTGMTDAIGILRLGGVFTSVMTGNMVLLGTAAGRHSVSIASHVGLAFGAYAVGTIVGARVAGKTREAGLLWPPSVTLALAVELFAFSVFTCGWELVGGRPGTGLGLFLLALNAVALGVQSSAVLRLGISGLSTTYLTGTLTGVLVAVATRAPLREALRSIAILLGLLTGAAVGAALAISAPRFAPIPLLVALAYVIAVASIRLRNAERPCNLIVSAAN